MTITESALTADEQQVSDLVEELLSGVPAEAAPTRSPSSERSSTRAWPGCSSPKGFGGLGSQPEAAAVDQRAGVRRGRPERVVPQPDRLRHDRPRPLPCGAATSRRAATCGRCSPVKRSGASCSASPAPARTSPVCPRKRRQVTATSGSATARRCGPRLAHLSRWGLLVVRTDPEAVKHAGLTAFVVDMHDPTVDVRPLRQMTGEAEFNEVYFTDTRVPDSRDARQAGRRLARVADHPDERARVHRRGHPAAWLRRRLPSGQDLAGACRPTARTRPSSTR